DDVAPVVAAVPRAAARRDGVGDGDLGGVVAGRRRHADDLERATAAFGRDGHVAGVEAAGADGDVVAVDDGEAVRPAAGGGDVGRGRHAGRGGRAVSARGIHFK